MHCIFVIPNPGSLNFSNGGTFPPDFVLME